MSAGNDREHRAKASERLGKDGMCPCGSGKGYDQCCGAYLEGKRWPEDAETMVRARFTAFCLHNWPFLEKTECQDEKTPAKNIFASVDMRKEAEEGKYCKNLRILGSGKDAEGKYEYVRYEYTLMVPITGAEQWEQKDYFTRTIQDNKIYYTSGTDFTERDVPTEDSIFLIPADTDMCPCESGKTYAKCCGPYIKGRRWPANVEAMVRARFTAYRIKDWKFLRDTQFADETPGEETYSLLELQEESERGTTWSGLHILESGKGSDNYGYVQYEYIFDNPEDGKTLLEQRDYFTTVGGEIYYTTRADFLQAYDINAAFGEEQDLDACPCGSGKRYDECCGPYLEGKRWPEDVEAMVRSRFTACARRDKEYLDATSRIDKVEDRHFVPQNLPGVFEDPQIARFFRFVLYNRGVDSEGREYADWMAKGIKSGDEGTELKQWQERSLCERVGGKLYYTESSPTPRTVYRAAQRKCPCPCGSGKRYETCCRPYLEGERWPEDIETMARTRFCAMACNKWEYLERTARPGEGRTLFRADELNALADTCDILWTEVETLEKGKRDDEEYLDACYSGQILGGDMELQARCYFRRVDGKIYCSGIEPHVAATLDEPDTWCPCGREARYSDCCAPYHNGTRLPEDACTLVRTRMSAMKLGRRDYLARTSRLKHGETPLSTDMLSMLHRMGLNTNLFQQYSQGRDTMGREYIDGSVCWMDSRGTFPQSVRYFYEKEDGRIFYTGMRELSSQEAIEAGDFAFPCPCGSGQTYGECCASYLTEVAVPDDAISFVRARCCAFAMNALAQAPHLEPELPPLADDEERNPPLVDVLEDVAEENVVVRVKQAVILRHGKKGLEDPEGLAIRKLGVDDIECVDYQLDCAVVAPVNLNDQGYMDKGLMVRELAFFMRMDGTLTYLGGIPMDPLPVRRAPKVGRNDPCPCGSGKKYKKCCGKNA